VTVRGGLGVAEGAGPIVLEISLKEGFNEIVVMVVDEAGNEGASYVLRAMLDTTPPSISIAEPLNGSSTKDMEIRVRGTVEPGSTVKVKGVEVQVAGDGSFSTLTTIAEGPNIIHVQATDRVGLVTDANVTVTREASKKEDQPGLGHIAAIVAMAAVAAPLAVASRRRHR
jgi:bacillopeptidase F